MELDRCKLCDTLNSRDNIIRSHFGDPPRYIMICIWCAKYIHQVWSVARVERENLGLKQI